MARPKTSHNQNILYFTITACVMIVVIGITLYFVARAKQPTYFTSNEVKMLEFDTSTGPVSPEFQQSKTLILTPTTCSYTLTKIQPQSTTTANCPMSDAIWESIVSAYNSASVKAILTKAPADPDVLGGPQKLVTAVYANGDTYKAFVNTSVKSELQGFLQQVQAKVPELSNIQY
jgi:hypothetical protein